MKRVGRPPLPYKTRHVMVNMKDVHYEYMKKANMNMSQLINDYLDHLFNLKICPTCFTDDIDRRMCQKCKGEAIFCENEQCRDYQKRVGNTCPQEMVFGALTPICTSDEFFGWSST
jgi:hypothetical protein